MIALEAAQLAYQQTGSYRGAARVLGVHHDTVRRKLARVSAPVLPEADLPAEEIIAHKIAHFERITRRKAAEKWMPFKLDETRPFAIVWFGDPHLDDDGCNWPLLRRDIALAANTPGCYAACIGDITNNWVGRLMRLYAEQNTSRARARALARWFLNDAGVPWLFWVMGNHDAWESGEHILELSSRGTLMQSWDAKVEIRAAGKSWRVHAAHNFPGHSQWNIGHGPAKAAKMTSDADLFVCGHLHDWTVQQFESRDRVATVVRTRGYKWHDPHATTLGFQQSQSGASVMTIFNPAAPDPSGRVLAFADVATGAGVLRALRGPEGKSPQPKKQPTPRRKQSTRGRRPKASRKS